MRRFLPLLLCPLSFAIAGELFRDDFSRFPPREFGSPVKQLTNALHEYHYVEHRGVPLAPWANAMIHDDAWTGGDEDGKTYVEQHLVNNLSDHFNSTLIVGDPEWSDYTVEVKVRPLLMEDMAGVIFRYHANRPVNFWRNPGIVTLFDPAGNILAQQEPIHSGSSMLPVNWRGDGQEFVMLSGNVKEGGMIDGHLRRVVMFPDDGHPDLAYSVLDLTGDARDEIVLWDQKRVWVYTQDRPFEGKKIYAPIRNPLYNDSNYRTAVSLPAWKDAGR